MSAKASPQSKANGAAPAKAHYVLCENSRSRATGIVVSNQRLPRGQVLGDDAPAMTPVLPATTPIGRIVESAIIPAIEARTVKLWGMRR